MLALAQKNEQSNIFLNAGRGNPNWIQTISRLAFARLVQFGVYDSKQTIDNGIMADVLEVVRFIAAQRRLGEVRLLRKLFQRQATLHTQVFQAFLDC